MAVIAQKPKTERSLMLDHPELSRDVFSKFVLADLLTNEERYIELKTKNLQFFDSDNRYWRFNPIVSNLPRFGEAGCLTVTEMRNDASEALSVSCRFLLSELSSVSESILANESVCIGFGRHYNLRAQTCFHHLHRKFGETGDYAIVGALVKRLL